MIADVAISRDASADAWSSSAGLIVRPFAERDYARQAAIGAAINPGLDRGLAWYRHCDQSWDPSLRRLQLVAERDNLVVGWGDVGHMWWAYHRRWEARLVLSEARVERFAGAYGRMAQQGIEIVTLAEERARRGKQLLRD